MTEFHDIDMCNYIIHRTYDRHEPATTVLNKIQAPVLGQAHKERCMIRNLGHWYFNNTRYNQMQFGITRYIWGYHKYIAIRLQVF